MQAKEHLLEHLKSLTGGSLLITPKQLEKVIGTTAKQQSKLREEGRFPIPHINMGRNVLYSIYAVADVLLTGETKEKPTAEKKSDPIIVSQEVSSPPPKKRATRHSAPQDLSPLILVRSFISSLEAQRENINFLIEHFTLLADTTDRHNDFQSKLASKPEIKKNNGKI